MTQKSRSALAIGLAACLATTPFSEAEAQTQAETPMSRMNAGRYPEAEALARKKVADVSASKGANSPQTAVAWMELAGILDGTGRSAEAEEAVRRALAIWEPTGNAQGIASALGVLVVVLIGRNAYPEAEAASRRLIDLIKPANNPGLLAAGYEQLGRTLNFQERLEEADTAYRQALEIRRSQGANERDLASLYIRIATNLQDMNRLPEAETLYRRGLKAFADTKGLDNQDTMTAQSSLAKNLAFQGKLTEAEQAIRASLAARERIFGQNAAPTHDDLETLALVLIAQKKFAEAEPISRRLVEYRTQANGGNWEDLVADQGRMGQVLGAQNRAPEAIPYYRRAIELSKANLGAGHPMTARALLTLGGTLVQIDPKDPEPIKLAAEALGIVRSDRAKALAGRGGTAGQQALSRAVGAQAAMGEVEDLAHDVYLSLGQLRFLQFPQETDAVRRESFLVAQESVQSAAGRAMALTAAREAAGTGALGRLVRRQQDLSDKARAQNEALIAALSRSPDAGAQLRAENAALGEELAAIDATLRRDFPDYVRMIAPDPVAEQDLQKRLEKDEGLLLIVDTGDSILLFGISPGAATFKLSEVPPAVARKMIAALRCQVDPVTCGGESGPGLDYDRTIAFDLYRGLVAPVEAAFRGAKTLYVTASGPIGDVPLAALATSPPGGADSGWLGDRYAFVSLPSVAALRAVQRPRRGGGRFAGYGAPTLADPGASRGVPPAAAPKGVGKGPPLADPAAVRALPSLPGTAVELQAMARTLDAPSGAIRTGSQATEAAVRADPRLGDARVIAFATHGLLPGELDGFAEPGLVFTPPAAPSPADDGILAASEAAALKLSADWVILSACNTASPEGGNGSDSLSALARAFLYAGADSLLASHWRVGDEVTAALTVETLANARRDSRAGRAAALQAAMRAIRTGKRADGSAVEGWNADWAHPAAWAPFTLISDGN